MHRASWLTVLGLCLATFLVSGCGGNKADSGGKKRLTRNKQRVKASKRDAGRTAKRTAASSTDTSGRSVGGKQGSKPSELSVAYIPDDAFAALVLHPARALRAPILKPFVESALFTTLEEDFGIVGREPREIDRVMLIVSDPASPQAMFLAMTEGVDVRKAVEEMTPRSKWGSQDGVDFRQDPYNNRIVIVDQKTILVGKTKVVERMVRSGRTPDGPLVRRLRQRDLSADLLAIAIATPQVQTFTQQKLAAEQGMIPPQFSNVRTVAPKLDSIVLSISLRTDPMMRVEFSGRDA